ncbi:hypothetical protein BDV29DRAFT_162886 [Aspergillus leporis]|uniref:Uncharacterized protein n=1 Tax=Aspergillus leporis TaxID=41062 RepID=A0A5N5WHF8_9EURO|nr:hypothetical protein BDV29DRAFT_162886 [Aspergillus leporis]
MKGPLQSTVEKCLKDPNDLDNDACVTKYRGKSVHEKSKWIRNLLYEFEKKDKMNCSDRVQDKRETRERQEPHSQLLHADKEFDYILHIIDLIKGKQTAFFKASDRDIEKSVSIELLIKQDNELDEEQREKKNKILSKFGITFTIEELVDFKLLSQSDKKRFYRLACRLNLTRALARTDFAKRDEVLWRLAKNGNTGCLVMNLRTWRSAAQQRVDHDLKLLNTAFYGSPPRKLTA